VSLFTVQRIERGEGAVRPGTARAIAKALGVTPEDLADAPKADAPLSLEVAEQAGLAGSEVSYEAQRRRFNYLAGGIERDVRRWEEWIAEVRDSADVPSTDPRTWARTIGLAAMGRYADVEAQGAVEALKAEAERTPEGARLRAALDALLAIPQKATDASVGARQVSAVLEEVEGKGPELLASEKQASLVS
ncbi:MAG: helix-turn-helix domain-containing protein, partial [Actinomycetota bacterium]|nr:helix-turn-helix domain-containing protein [Actinomycetota bacterium]